MNSDDPDFKDTPFPPVRVTRLVAIGWSIATPFVLVLCWGPYENQSDAAEKALGVAGLLFLGSLFCAWVTEVLNRQGHWTEATIGFVMTVGLTAAAAVVGAPYL